VRDFGFDPQRALESIKQAVAEAPAQLAEGFTRVVRDAPEGRIEQLMRSPARKPILDGIFWQMPKLLDRERARGVRASVRWCITGRTDGAVDTYQLEIDNGSAHVIHGPNGPDPGLTITVDGAEFLRLASGNSDPMNAYFKGRIVLVGDIMLAAKLASLFRMPGSGSGSGSGPGPEAPTP
jgi:putative sterol carrier protein